LITNNRRQRIVELINRSSPTRTYAKDIVIAMLDGEQICARHISYKDIVLLLFAIPVDAHNLMVKEPFGEDSYHTRLPIGILARAIHIAVAQRCIVQFVCLLPVT